MKKTLMWILILVFAASSLFVVGCGDDDNGGGGGSTKPPDADDERRFDYAVEIYDYSLRSRYYDWQILVSSTDCEDMNSVELSINGLSVDIDQSVVMPQYWYCYYDDFVYGQTYTIAAVIDGNSYNQDITIAHMPYIYFPDFWDMSEPLDLSWVMDGDNMWQGIEGSAWWWNPEIDDEEGVLKEMSVSPNARNATVPANWLGVPLQYVYESTLTLGEFNWGYNNRFLVMSVALQSIEYGDDLKSYPHDITRRHIDKVLDLIGR